MPSYWSDRGLYRGAAKVRCQGSPGVGEQGKAVKGTPGKLGEPPVPSDKHRNRVTTGLPMTWAGEREPWLFQQRIDKVNRGSCGRRQGQEMGRGSLSVFGVVIESGETDPGEPMSNEGRHRGMGPLSETRFEH